MTKGIPKHRMSAVQTKNDNLLWVTTAFVTLRRRGLRPSTPLWASP